MDLTIPIISERRQQERQIVELQPGGHSTMLVVARRSNFSGEIQLDTTSLPEGVQAQFVPIEADSHLGYVHMTAAEDAPLGHGLFQIQGRAETPSGSVGGTLKQDIGLVFGPPRQTVYHSIEVDQIPIVVTEKQPFKLYVSQPKTPLVRDGRLELNVQIERAPEFEDDVTLTLPFLPPWIEVPEDDVVIPEGESTVIFPLTSTIDADPRSWNIAIAGEAITDGQSTFVSSNTIPITVADPYVGLEIQTAVVEQGTSTELVCELKWLSEQGLGGTAELRGLPTNANSPELTIRPGQRSLKFPIQVGTETPASIHNTLIVELSINEPTAEITHYLGRGGTLEVFATGAQAREKLSRLEVLRRKARRQASSSTAAFSNSE